MVRYVIGACLASLALGTAAMPLFAAPQDSARARVAAYKQLGENFKAINDMVRSGDVQPPLIRRYAVQIRNMAKNQYSLFPANSGPQPGVKTAALKEIWTRPGDFRAAQDNFARQAEIFQRVAMTSDVATIRTEARKLGGACKQCHDNFRAQSE
jgi:cytochrome c556